jgi:hypothetical protein
VTTSSLVSRPSSSRPSIVIHPGWNENSHPRFIKIVKIHQETDVLLLRETICRFTVPNPLEIWSHLVHVCSGWMSHECCGRLVASIQCFGVEPRRSDRKGEWIHATKLWARPSSRKRCYDASVLASSWVYETSRTRSSVGVGHPSLAEDWRVPPAVLQEAEPGGRLRQGPL